MKDLQMTAVEELQFAAEQDKIDLSDYMPLVARIFEEQIIKAWTDGKYCNTLGNEINYEDGEQYYAETYGK
jgi:hypothetical protein